MNWLMKVYIPNGWELFCYKRSFWLNHFFFVSLKIRKQQPQNNTKQDKDCIVEELYMQYCTGQKLTRGAISCKSSVQVLMDLEKCGHMAGIKTHKMTSLPWKNDGKERQADLPPYPLQIHPYLICSFKEKMYF